MYLRNGGGEGTRDPLATCQARPRGYHLHLSV